MHGGSYRVGTPECGSLEDVQPKKKLLDAFAIQNRKDRGQEGPVNGYLKWIVPICV